MLAVDCTQNPQSQFVGTKWVFHGSKHHWIGEIMVTYALCFLAVCFLAMVPVVIVYVLEG